MLVAEEQDAFHSLDGFLVDAHERLNRARLAWRYP